MKRPFALADIVWRLGENRNTAGVVTSLASLFPSLVRMTSQATRIGSR